MLKKNKKLISLLLIMFQLMNIVSFHSFASEKDSDGVTLVTKENTYEKTGFFKPSMFGIAGGFHLVGFNSVSTGSHVNGNILTKNLNYQSNFGTKGVEEVSYIQEKIDNTQGFQGTSHQRSVIVVGENIKTGTADNGSAWSLNGNKVDKPEKRTNEDSLWKDKTEKFIDIDLLENEMIDLSKTLSKHENNSTYIENNDKNKQSINIKNSEVFNIYNLKKGDFDLSNDINIYGFDKSKPTTLIINVDMKDFGNSFSLKKSVIHYTDGSTAPTGEVSTWQNANVIWNIFDSSKDDYMFKGNITNQDAITGLLLSPGADVNMTKNFNGTIIAKNIKNSGETHRDDYVPSNINIPVKKIWKGKAQSEVEITLLADGKKVKTVTLNDKNDWKHIFKDLPLVDEKTNKKIEYTIEEKKIDGYQTEIKESRKGFIIINTKIKKIKTKNIPVKKIWKGKAQSEVKITLLADGKEIDRVTLSDKNNWEHVFTDLQLVDKYTGEKINYTVKEKEIEGYKSEIKEIKNGFIIINTEKEIPGLTQIPVKKIWKGKAQSEVKITLLADGKEIDRVTLSDKNNWEHVFTDLQLVDKYTGEKINYTVKEKEIEGYKSNIKEKKGEFVITNTELDKSIIPIKKIKQITNPSEKSSISNIKTSNPKTYDKGIFFSVIILIFAIVAMVIIFKIKR
ncbi:MAG: Cna B-type domain-containing protein [Peptostreptococcus sp.]|uniref:Cna B-type domain-containing protein n=1 Tax=Peptostreptococcus sp. TaxID=1262 RepID=UPI002FC8D724